MTTKHSPAPWTSFPTPHDLDFAFEIQGVCSVLKGDHANGNHALLRAAPELLEALQDVLEACVHIMPTHSPLSKRARAAIKKATQGDEQP